MKLFNAVIDKGQVEALGDPVVVEKYSRDVEDGLYEWELNFCKASGFFGSPGKRLLSLGCGGGREAFPLAQMGYEVTAIDACADLIDHASQVARASNLRVQFLQSRVPPLASCLGEFSHIMATYNFLSYIYDLAELKLLLRQVGEHLAPDGKFFFTFHDRASVTRSRDGYGIVKDMPQLPAGNCARIKARFFRRDELFPLIEGAGLRVTHCRNICELVQNAEKPLKWAGSTMLCLASH